MKFMRNVRDVIHFLKERLHAGVVVEDQLRAFMPEFNPVKILAVGKAACEMAYGAKRLFPFSSGLIVTKEGHSQSVPDFEVIEACHPIPNKSSVYAAQRVIQFIESIQEPTLVLISGGASALLCYPLEGITLEHKMQLTDDLLNSGADISEINLVRQCLSRIKGGKLAQRISPKWISDVRVALISDVVGNDISMISSGPFYSSNANVLKAFDILDAYDIQLPASVRSVMHQSHRSIVGKNPPHYVISDVKHALSLTTRAFESLGYAVYCMAEPSNGLIQDNIRDFTDWISYNPRSVWISGGECTVKHSGNGKGGRNQQWVVEAGLKLIDLGFSDFQIFSYATDGNDGPTDSAGAWLESSCLIEHCKEAQRAAKNYDTFGFLNDIGGHLLTGPSGTNVNDIRGVVFS